MLKNGATIKEIAVEFGISKSAVSQRMAGVGVDILKYRRIIKNRKLKAQSKKTTTSSSKPKALDTTGTFKRIEPGISTNLKCYKAEVFTGNGVLRDYFGTIDEARVFRKT